MAEKTKSKKTTSLPPDQGLSFEEALAALEETVGRLEEKDLKLDAALALFEKGISFIRTCDGHLKKAQGRVTELLKSENGEYVEKILGDTLDAFTSAGNGNA